MHFSGTCTLLLIPFLLFVVYVYTFFLYCYSLFLHLTVIYSIKKLHKNCSQFQRIMRNLTKYQCTSSHYVGQSDRTSSVISEYYNTLDKTVEWRRSVVWGMPTPDRAKEARTRIVMACNLESFHLQQRETVNLRNQSNELLTLLPPFHSTGL
jgi:hypothetical protein